MAQSDNAKQPVTVPIFGQSYTVQSDDAHGVQHAADAVDQRMQEISRRTKTMSPTRLAVLAALYFAYEQYKSWVESPRTTLPSQDFPRCPRLYWSKKSNASYV